MSTPYIRLPHLDRRKFAAWLLTGLAAATAVILCYVPRFTDPPAYFNFADHRIMLRIPHFMDVVSNLPFALIGILGLLSVFRGGKNRSSLEPWERQAFATIFAGLLLIAAGSSYFHFAPTPATLVWDRLPMTIVFMSFFAIALGDRLDPRAGRILFVPLIALGIASVLYWRYTEQTGSGDLRLYIFVQFFPMLVLPILALLPARHIRQSDLAMVVAFYAVAKLLELLDAPVFAATGFISGHTLKHVFAALAAASMLRVGWRYDTSK